jgi:hypothetical protein
MRALLAYESGYGLGHVNRLADVARRLRPCGFESALATYRLDDADRFADSFDAVLQAPVWPSFFGSQKSLLSVAGPSFATALVNLGFREARHVAANQRAWAELFDACKPDVVIADFAPGAILAAKGRCLSVQIGGPFYTPAMDGEKFPPFLGEEATDGEVEIEISSAIDTAMARLGRTPPAALSEAVIADQSLPMGFAEFDPHLPYRKETLLAPDMLASSSFRRERGDSIFAYIPEWLQHNDVLMASLCALGLPVRLFMPNIPDGLAEGLTGRNVSLATVPFSTDELARSARVFLHHGGLGSSQIGLVAGVPQVSVESDMEKIVNGRALTTLGVGRSLRHDRLTLPRLRDTVTALYEDDAVQKRTADVAGEMRARLGGQHPLDTVVDCIVLHTRPGN